MPARARGQAPPRRALDRQPVSHDGPGFYDDAGVSDRYAQLRARAGSANDTLEAPVIAERIRPVLRGTHAALRPGGGLVFSTEHPVITCSNKALGDDGLRQDWMVDD